MLRTLISFIPVSYYLDLDLRINVVLQLIIIYHIPSLQDAYDTPSKMVHFMHIGMLDGHENIRT